LTSRAGNTIPISPNEPIRSVKLTISSRRIHGAKVKITAVSQAAKKLREIILASGDGAYLGSREELVRTLEVGQVTLQQAARVLERERLLVVRRGPNGGYFARWPDEAGVEEAIAVYLRVKNAGFREALIVGNVLLTEMAALAAQSCDETAREALRALRDRIEGADLSDPRELLRLDEIFGERIFQLASNPFAELILLVTGRMYVEGGAISLLWTRGDVEAWRFTRLNMIKAMLEHDDEVVRLFSRRFTARIFERMEAETRRIRAGLPPSTYGAPDQDIRDD
jgi:GntR family transcriptional repressor for pyruvate dehydrogenase complex